MRLLSMDGSRAKQAFPVLRGFLWTVLCCLSQEHKTTDLLRTSVEHIADQITLAINKHIAGEDIGPVRLEKILLVTGGGALNKFLMEVLQEKVTQRFVPVTIVETDKQTVVFKEASVFAFLGLRCLLGLSNTMRGVTGARRDVVAGSIHVPPGGASISFEDLGQSSVALRPRSRSHATASAGMLGEGLGGFIGSGSKLGMPAIKGQPNPKAKMPKGRKISAPPSMSYLSLK